MVKRLAAFSGMVLGTAVTGFVLGILGTLIGAWLLKGDFAGFGDLVGAILGMVFGYPIGVIVGMVLINKVLHYRGSLLLGTAGVVLAVVLFFVLSEPLGLNLNAWVLWSIVFALPPLLGTIGFHLRER